MDDMDDVKKILGTYASGAAGVGTRLVAATVLGLSAPASCVLGLAVALGGMFASFCAD